MSLFDEEEKLDLFDEDEKVRLFETYERSTRSLKNYAKVILPIVLLVIVAAAVTMYLSLPGIGDEVKAPKELEDQVYDYMLTKEKRTTSEMVFYKCDGYFWVKLTAEPRAYPPSNLRDPVNQYRLTAAPQVDGSYLIATVDRMEQKDDDRQCRVGIVRGND